MEAREAVAELINILIGCSTTSDGEAEYGANHEHSPFDKVDKELLRELLNKLTK